MTVDILGPDIDHEQVVFCRDRRSGLKAIIAIYSTALGPALGGLRFHAYQRDEDALADVLRLSKGMAYKNSLAGLDLGGGKAVIIGDPTKEKTEALLRAYGRFVHSLGGRYVTACDMGTYVDDMEVIARETPFVAGRSAAQGGAGDVSVLTAYGVFQGMRAAAEYAWGTPTLRGRRVGVAGVGKVGRRLVELLLDDGAELVVTDVSQQALDLVTGAHPEVGVVDDADALVRSEIDVYAPCALGGAIDDRTLRGLGAQIVCGGANNQLAHSGIEKQLVDRGILYAPDYLVNAGGVIAAADETQGFVFERAKAKTARVFETTREIFRLAAEEGVTPTAAADRLAEQRIAEVGRLRGVLLPGRP